MSRARHTCDKGPTLDWARCARCAQLAEAQRALSRMFATDGPPRGLTVDPPPVQTFPLLTLVHDRSES